MSRPNLEMSIQRVAPAYEFQLITIKDPFGVESRWIVPGEKKLGTEELEVLCKAHDHYSQVETKRN